MMKCDRGDLVSECGSCELRDLVAIAVDVYGTRHMQYRNIGAGIL